MPEEPEIEMQEIKEKILEMQEEEKEEFKWVRQVALATAIIAVFAAVGSMQSGALVNEAMMNQIKAADKWNEYQANKLKAHEYTLRIDEISDNFASGSATRLEPYTSKRDEYVDKAEKELGPEAKKLEGESEHLFHKHHQFAIAVTLAQVAIALSAISVLTKQKLVFYGSVLLGVVGIVLMLSQLI